MTDQESAKLEREKLNGDNHVIEIAATEQNEVRCSMFKREGEGGGKKCVCVHTYIYVNNVYNI